jgi:hypothetical protein
MSLIVGGDVTSDKWGGSVAITLREQETGSKKFESVVDRTAVDFSTASANLRIGSSAVTVLPNGDYRVVAKAQGADGPVAVNLVVSPVPRAYFPGASLGSDAFVSGYAVPALRATASGSICVAGKCEVYDAVQSYHDHNWGVWQGVSWDWGASRAGAYTILYGRVIAPGAKREAPLFVYLIDSLGFKAVMRPATIEYTDGRTTSVAGKRIEVPSRAVFADIRGPDTLRVQLDIEDAIATDMRQSSQQDRSVGKQHFIQMKGTATLSGRVGGEPVSGTGNGFFETYR